MRIKIRRIVTYTLYATLLYLFFNIFVSPILLNSNSRNNRINLNQIQQRMRQRASEISELCPKKPRLTGYQLQRNLLNHQMDDSHKIVSCLPEDLANKIGWNFLFYNIRQLSREYQNLERESFVSYLILSRGDIKFWNGLANLNTQAEFLKFILVRHPLARLYENWEKEYEKPILNRSGPGQMQINTLNANNENDYIDRVKRSSNSEKVKSNLYGQSSRKDDLGESAKMTSWKAFINKFAITVSSVDSNFAKNQLIKDLDANNLKKHDTVIVDDHFKPLSEHCQICSLPLDFVMKIENLYEDSIGLESELSALIEENIFSRLKFDLDIRQKSAKIKQIKSEIADKFYSFKEISKFYGRDVIDDDALTRIMAYYRNDLKLLGYYFDLKTRMLGMVWPG